MKQGNLNIRCTEDYAVLYWDKPAAAPSGAEYTVSLNGEAVGRTDRTHFTIEGLSYGSSFQVDAAATASARPRCSSAGKNAASTLPPRPTSARATAIS